LETQLNACSITTERKEGKRRKGEGRNKRSSPAFILKRKRGGRKGSVQNTFFPTTVIPILFLGGKKGEKKEGRGDSRIKSSRPRILPINQGGKRRGRKEGKGEGSKLKQSMPLSLAFLHFPLGREEERESLGGRTSDILLSYLLGKKRETGNKKKK